MSHVVAVPPPRPGIVLGTHLRGHLERGDVHNLIIMQMQVINLYCII